jgi:hypothetical protein
MTNIITDFIFGIVCTVLGHYEVIEVSYPTWQSRWFEAEDLAPITTFYSEETRQ